MRKLDASAVLPLPVLKARKLLIAMKPAKPWKF